MDNEKTHINLLFHIHVGNLVGEEKKRNSYKDKRKLLKKRSEIIKLESQTCTNCL
jgi:hypothetical protein